MSPVFWFTIQVGQRRVPIPIVLLLPLMLVIDILALIGLSIYGVWKRASLFLKLATGFYLFRFTLTFILYGGHFRIGVHDKNEMVRIFGGWNY